MNIYPEQRIVFWRGAPARLSKLEWALFEILRSADQRGKAVGVGEIAVRLYAYSGRYELQCARYAVHRLRRRLPGAVLGGGSGRGPAVYRLNPLAGEVAA